MKNENKTQRNSAPTGAQDSSSELNADRPLGGAACSASDFPLIIGKILFFDDGSWRAYGAIDQKICSLPEYQEQSTNSSEA